MGILRDVGTALTMVAAAASMFGLTDPELARLNSFVNMRAQGWIAAQKREEEVNEYINSEARIISGK